MKCPYTTNGQRCLGELEYLGGVTTLLGYFNGTDENKQTEDFRCKECKRYFTRSWKWKDITAEMEESEKLSNEET